MIDTFKWPWRIETRASLFHPYRSERAFATLEAALNAYRKMSPRFARIRAN